MMHEGALSRHPLLKSIGRALPSNYYRQEEILSSALWNAWSGKVMDRSRFERIRRSVSVHGRHLALPMEEYRALDSFGKANDNWVERAADLGEQAVVDALNHADLSPHDIDHIFCTTVTGIASPSIDAKLVNRLSMRADIKPPPIFRLGCVGGPAGIARAADYLRGFPEHTALLVSVELCSLTLRREGNLLSYRPGRGRTRRLLSVHASVRAGPRPRRDHRRPGLCSFKIQNAWRRLDSELSEQVIKLGRRDKPSIISSPSRLAIAHDVGNQSRRDEKRNEKTRSCGGVERAR
jgi:hypothetical protein